jgi:hypothetical protein
MVGYALRWPKKRDQTEKKPVKIIPEPREARNRMKGTLDTAP